MPGCGMIYEGPSPFFIRVRMLGAIWRKTEEGVELRCQQTDYEPLVNWLVVVLFIEDIESKPSIVSFQTNGAFKYL